MVVAWPLRFQPSSLLFSSSCFLISVSVGSAVNIFELASRTEGRSTHEIQNLP
jgi:hypothetical protein